MHRTRTQIQPLLRRVGVLSVALFLIACAGGLGYVVHLTRHASEVQASSQPSLLPLAALAVLIGLAGVAAFRAALHDSERDA